MLHPDVLSSFSNELEKQAMNWRIPLATSLAGAGTAAYLTGKQALPEHRQDVLMHDMDVMSDEIYKRRTKRRALEVGGAAALGGIAGAAAPFVVSSVGRKLVDKAKSRLGYEVPRAAARGREHLDRARRLATEQASTTARQVGREFTDSALETAARRKAEVKELAAASVSGAVEGARSGGKGVGIKDLLFGVK